MNSYLPIMVLLGFILIFIASYPSESIRPLAGESAAKLASLVDCSVYHELSAKFAKNPNIGNRSSLCISFYGPCTKQDAQTISKLLDLDKVALDHLITGVEMGVREFIVAMDNQESVRKVYYTHRSGSYIMSLKYNRNEEVRRMYTFKPLRKLREIEEIIGQKELLTLFDECFHGKWNHSFKRSIIKTEGSRTTVNVNVKGCGHIGGISGLRALLEHTGSPKPLTEKWLLDRAMKFPSWVGLSNNNGVPEVTIYFNGDFSFKSTPTKNPSDKKYSEL